MRSRLTSIALSVALALPGVGVGVLATALTAKPAGAVSKTASWTDNSSGWDRSSSPTIADVNNDGTADVVIGHQDGWLRVVSGVNGHNVPGWPQKAIINGANGTAIDSTPTVADLFKDGQKKIVVGVGSTWVHNQQGGVIIFNANGTRHCVFQTRDFGNVYANTGVADGYSDPVFSSPAVGDINGDGYPDIVFGSFDFHVYAIDRNCHTLIDYNIEDSTWSSPALYDVDGDGRQEIFIGGDQTAGGAIDWSGGEFRALKYVPRRAGQHGRALEEPHQRHRVVEPRDRRHRRRRSCRSRGWRGILVPAQRRPRDLRVAPRRRFDGTGLAAGHRRLDHAVARAR